MASTSVDSSSKCTKATEGSDANNPNVDVDENGESMVDRVSSLPDSLLCHILSFLPTKDAVATTFLSTLWKHVFSSTPNLKLDFDDSGMSKDRFERFVDKVLHVDLHDAPHVHAMRLCCKHEYRSRIKAWISAAVRLNVVALDLKFTIREPRWLANEISHCTRLTSLKLTNSPIYVPDSFRLPNLKLLNLQRMGLFREATIANMFRGCPVLKELIMNDCRVYAQTLDIAIPSLKSLTVQDCVFLLGDGVFEEIDDYEIALDMPDLEELCYSNYNVAARYTVREMAFLQRAQIDVKPDADQQEEEDSICFNINVAELVITCSMARWLYLSARTLQAIYCSHRVLSVFPKLEHLNLQLSVVCPRIWGLVIHILDCTPNLFSLGIEMGLQKYEECQNCEIALGGWIPYCVALHLRKISILAFTGMKQEILLLLYFLMHARTLEKMVINIDHDLNMEQQLSFKENLLKLPHSSNACQVVVKTSAEEKGDI